MSDATHVNASVNTTKEKAVPQLWRKESKHLINLSHLCEL